VAGSVTVVSPGPSGSCPIQKSRSWRQLSVIPSAMIVDGRENRWEIYELRKYTV
jgi:hypothetical protein